MRVERDERERGERERESGEREREWRENWRVRRNRCRTAFEKNKKINKKKLTSCHQTFQLA